MQNSFTQWLIGSGGLTPHGFCLLWEPGLIWTHALSDIAIGLAYLNISAALIVVARRRRDLVFPRLLWLFAAFILLCGLSHWFDTLTLWVSAYGAQGIVKAATACVSAMTSVLLWRVMPKILQYPSSAQYREALDAVRLSERFLEQTGRLAGVGGWELDLPTGHLSWTAETFRMHGAPEHEPALARAIDFYAPEARPIAWAAVEQGMATGQEWDLELPFIRADGEHRWVRSVGSAICIDGKPVRLVGALQDVTHFVEQRKALEAVNERMNLATVHAGIGIWERNINKTEMIWNKAMFRIYGHPPADDVAAEQNISYEFWRQHVHPDDLEGVNAAVLVGEQFLQPYEIEFRIIWPDGSIRHICAYSKPTFASDGSLARALGINQDVTEARVLAAERDGAAACLAESEANSRLILDNCSDMISRVGQDGQRLYASAATESVFDVSAEVFMERDIATFVHKDDLPFLAQLQADMLAGTRRDARLAFRVLSYKRGEVWVETNARSLRDKVTSLPAGYISVTRDITERVQMEDERERYAQELRRTNAELERLSRHMAKARGLAEQASRAKTRFLAAMSHELRTPLNGILGYAQLLRMDGELSAKQSERVLAMQEAGAHLLELISCVLDLSEIETSGTDLQSRSLDIVGLAQACLDIVRPTAEGKRLALRLSIAPGLPRHFVGDATRLRQVLLNLLGNAVKYTASGSVQLSLSTALAIDPQAGPTRSRAASICRDSADGWHRLRLEVADTGPGIPLQKRSLLFEEFERLDAASGETEGSGLGLALAKRIAVLLGGTLSYADNPCGGSLFRLDLPLLAGADPVPPPGGAYGCEEPPRPMAALPAPGSRVLLVDDIAMNRDIAAAFLHSAGCDVDCAEDGAQAVALAASSDYCVVLMDVQMPGMSGLEAARLIRAAGDARAQVSIVALTAQVFSEQIEECRAAGMDTHLAKPFTREALLAAVVRGVAQGHAGKRDVSAPSSPTHSGRSPRDDAPIFNTESFNRTADLLNPAAVKAYLDEISTRTESLRVALGDRAGSGEFDNTLAASAHSLSGSAGMFGFDRLSLVAREFEHAVAVKSDKVTALGEHLYEVLGTSHAVLRGKTVELEIAAVQAF